MSKNQDLGELINGIKSLGTNQLNAPAYTSATSFTGTIAGYLGFDNSGNILTIASTSQWITTGANIYYNTGNVAIGTTNAAYNFNVLGTSRMYTLIVGAAGLSAGNYAIFSNDDSFTYIDTIKVINQGDFQFRFGGTPKMVITYGGNVGMGTISPAYKLDVVGDVNITGTYRVNGTPIGTGGGGVSGSGTANYIAKWSAGTALTNSQIFDNGSSIGLRTASPFYVIDYQLTGSLRLGYFIGSIDGTDNASGIVAHNGNGITQTVPFGFSGSKFAWYIGTNEAMRIDTNRNLLINTTGGVTGGGALQVNGDVNVTGTFRVNGVQYSTGGGGGGITGGGTADFIPKFTGSTSIGNSALWDNGNFSVHLGMTTFSGTGGDPQRYIAIYGPESSGIIFKGDINDSQATSFIKRTNGVGNLTLYDTREVYLQASSSNYFKMNGSGIGINVQPFGTPYVLTLPNNSLQVAVAFSWLTYSDGRVKKEIKEIKYGINEVMKMKPVQYKHYSSEFINNTLNIGEQYTNEIGFVAQDIHEIVKEAVNRGSDTELWSLDKSKLIPVLVKAVQELKAELDELKQNNT